MEVRNVSLDQIRGSAFHFRTDSDDLSQELVESIRVHGVKQPILLRPKDSFYEIVAGRRRVLACKKLGFASIPAIVEVLDDKSAFEIALTENLQRKNLSPFEEARAFLDYVDKYKWGSITELAKRINKYHSYIVDRLKLLELPEKLQKQIVSGRQFSVSHAEELLRLKSPEEMEEMAEAIQEYGLGRDTTSEIVKLVKEQAIPVDKAMEAVQAAEKLTQRAQRVAEQVKYTLIASEPEKAQRIMEIVDEEFKSMGKRLALFPERSRKMEPKFDKLSLWEERGVIPYTIWDFTYRDDYAGDKDFHGNCSPQIVEQCIWRFTEEGDLVVDPMAGSGTALDVCYRYKRRCIGYDIAPPEGRTDIIQNDSRNIPLDTDSVDMVFIHPPYWNLVYFTGAEDGLPDLSRVNAFEEFLQMLGQVFKECYRVLKPGKYMCVLLGDLVRDGQFIPLCRKAANFAEEIGFTDCGYAVKLAHGEVSRKKTGVIFAELAYTDNLKISHDLVMFFRKGEIPETA